MTSGFFRISFHSKFVKKRKMTIFWRKNITKNAPNIFKYKEFQCKMRMV